MLCWVSACWCSHFREGRRAHGDATLPRARWGWGSEGAGLPAPRLHTLEEKPQRPLHCHAPEQLLSPSVVQGDLGEGVPGSPHSAEPAVGATLPHAHRAGVRDHQWVFLVELRLILPLASHHWQRVPMPCWLPPGQTHQRATLAPGAGTNTVEQPVLALSPPLPWQ